MTQTHPTDSGDDLLIETLDGVATLTLNRPRARNALTFEMYAALARFCAEAPSDGSLKAAIIRGAGEEAFAAGTDMTQFRDFRGAEDALAYERRMELVLSAIERCPVPTVAALHGACAGGGAAIAAACDIRIAARDLKFGFPIARTLGNCLSAGSLSRLVALLGDGRVREMIFTARLLGAQEALAVGLVSEVLDDRAAVMARARELARTLAGHAPLTLRATKEALRRLRAARSAVEDEDLIALCYGSDDFREGMEAFLAKRKPVWSGH